MRREEPDPPPILGRPHRAGKMRTSSFTTPSMIFTAAAASVSQGIYTSAFHLLPISLLQTGFQCLDQLHCAHRAMADSLVLPAIPSDIAMV